MLVCRFGAPAVARNFVFFLQDMLNRDHAMLRLIQAAVESGRQFIFLTPLAFSQRYLYSSLCSHSLSTGPFKICSLSRSVLDTFKEQDEVEVVRMPTASRNVNGTQALTLDVDSDWYLLIHSIGIPLIFRLIRTEKLLLVLPSKVVWSKLPSNGCKLIV